MNGVSRGKITVGYVLLLGVLLYSLFFVQREMDKLTQSDNGSALRTDSLIVLLQEKDANTLRLLRALNETSDSMVSARDIEQIIARQDTVVVQQRVQRRTITHTDTIITPQRKKGFFRRLGEVFVPSTKDTAIEVKTTQEMAVDTLLDAYNPADSLHERILNAAQQKKANPLAQRRKRSLQRKDHALTARIDSLLKGYELETLLSAQEEAEYQQSVRRRSATTIGSIAIGAVLLSAVFLILIGRDLTRSNRYRCALEEANRRSEELLASREKLMLAITHDFKAPLGSIMGYIDLLARLTVDERQRFYLDNMKISSEHLLKLVSDLLEFHRLDLHKAEINRVTFHPNRLLEEIRVSFEPLTATKGLSLRCHIDPELEGAFISDPLRLRQIINNLLSNAVKFTQAGSITMTARYAKSRLTLAIIDTGKGMEPGDRERIFREFTRLPGAQGEEGFGLGLSIVRMLVQLLEGTIEVDSVPGEGSTFTLHLPLYPVATHSGGSEQATDESQQAAAITPPVAPLHLLLIDDDRIQLTLTAAMLSQSGITSVCCQQLDELLDALRTHRFDLLLTDVQMPALNGFDLLRLLRASNIDQAQTIPVVAVTARSDMQPQEFLQHGFTASLHKPFSVQELLQMVHGLGIYSSILSASDVLPVDDADALSKRFNIAALTTFSADDAEASASILSSFVTETRFNTERLRSAMQACNCAEIAAVAHKMIPLFTLMGATQLVTLLKVFETSGNAPFGQETADNLLTAIRLIEEVVQAVVHELDERARINLSANN